MLIKFIKPGALKDSDVTPEHLFKRRRDFLKTTAVTLGGAIAGSLLSHQAFAAWPQAGKPLNGVKVRPGPGNEKLTPLDDATSYNNFYEFGVGKSDPAKNSKDFKTLPWSIEVAGACAKPGRYDFEDLLSAYRLEERIYRHRCVETWSMVLPWVGVPLADVLKRMEPTSKARYVAFETLFDPKRMVGQRRNVLRWPYVEGLRLDEAMHPLSFLSVGLYGRALLPQNGAPLRLVVPWKYGFKSIKSIVKITFSENEPPTSWNISAPREYGFYANVNPAVSHPRWSQARERRIGDFFKRDTLMFNGYADEVAGLYTGMDLRTSF